MIHNSKLKGFTLLELLIVIAIIGILATMVFVLFNTGEILKKTRDGQRFSDLRAFHTALAFYTTTFPDTPTCDPSLVYVSLPSEIDLSGCGDVAGFSGWRQVSSAAIKNIDSTGWIPVNFEEVPGKSPIGFLPVDPRNTISGSCPVPGANSSDYYYRFACNTSESTWELDARIESMKYKDNEDRDGIDGGNYPERYELGRDTKLLPADE